MFNSRGNCVFTYKVKEKVKEITFKEDKRISEREIQRKFLYDQSLVDVNNQRVVVTDFTDEELQKKWFNLDIFTDSEYRNAQKRKSPIIRTRALNIREVRENYEQAKLGHKRKLPGQPVQVPDSIKKSREILAEKRQQKEAHRISYLLNPEEIEPTPSTKKQGM